MVWAFQTQFIDIWQPKAGLHEHTIIHAAKCLKTNKSFKIEFVFAKIRDSLFTGRSRAVAATQDHWSPVERLATNFC